MRLGRVVHDRVVLGHQRLDHVGVGDVADDQLDAVREPSMASRVAAYVSLSSTVIRASVWSTR